MSKLQWPVCMWICMVTHTGSQLESNVNYFQILKYPTELSSDYDFNKNSTANLCYHDYHDYEVADDHGDADEASVETQKTIQIAPSTPRMEYNAFLLKIFTNIAQQIRQSQCGGNSKTSTEMSTSTVQQSLAQVQPLAKNMAHSERSLRVYYKGQRPELEQQQEQAEADGTFNILQQLKLDEKQQQQQQQHNLKLQSQPDFLEESDLAQHHIGKADKKKKKKRQKKKKKPTKDTNKKKKKKKEPNHTAGLVGQPAHVLFASLTQKPQFHQQPPPSQHVPVTTSKPQHHHQFTPIKKIKYILRKNSIFKKKKKEYLNHLKHVIYPFVKFIAFFTILNPFTLAVFLFSLISPVVFGVIGFVALSFLIKPVLSILFGVKRTVSSINRKKLLEKRRRERLRNSRRPITIHKHYYQQTRLPASTPPHHLKFHQRPQNHQQQHHHNHHRHSKHFNPLLPHIKYKLKRDTLFGPNFARYEKVSNVK